MVVKLNIRFQLGRWSVQFGNEHGDLRVILWRHHTNNGAYARWQWNFRSKPKGYRQEEVPVIECVGAYIAPAHLLQIEPDDAETWPDFVGE